jgi:competence protein ComEC
MLPVVHNIFGVTSTYQLLSPLLSLLFIPFYPLVMLLHLLDFGGVLDTVLLWLFSLPKESVDNLLPLWIMLTYIGLSIGAIWEKRVFYIVIGFGFGYGGYLFT